MTSAASTWRARWTVAPCAARRWKALPLPTRSPTWLRCVRRFVPRSAGHHRAAAVSAGGASVGSRAGGPAGGIGHRGHAAGELPVSAQHLGPRIRCAAHGGAILLRAFGHGAAGLYGHAGANGVVPGGAAAVHCGAAGERRAAAGVPRLVCGRLCQVPDQRWI